MTPEQIKHKITLIKKLYAEYNQFNNTVIATLRIKVKSGKIYAFNFVFKDADFCFGNIRESGQRSIVGTELQKQIQSLHEFLTTFNNTDPNDPIKTFGFAQNKEDFIHYKQTADIQLETNKRVKDFIKIGFLKLIEHFVINKQFINTPTNSINEQS